ACKDQVHGCFAVFVGERKTVPGGLLVSGFGSGTRIDKILGDAAVDKLDSLTRDSFAMERRILLQGVINVVGDGEVLAEELLAHTIVEAGALVFESGGGEIVEEKA